MFYSSGNRPVYRIYHAPSGSHFLTADKAEYDSFAVAGAYGYVGEGIKFYATNY